MVDMHKVSDSYCASLHVLDLLAIFTALSGVIDWSVR